MREYIPIQMLPLYEADGYECVGYEDFLGGQFPRTAVVRKKEKSK